MTATATEVPGLDFVIASRYSSRSSFQIPTRSLSGSTLTAESPIQIPAVGYLESITLEIDLATSGGTDPDWIGDGPWTAIESIQFRNPSGVNIITPVNGFELMLINLLGGQTAFGASADPRAGINAPGDYAASQKMILEIPIGFDLSEALGVIPALSSSQNYQLEITWAAISTFAGGAPSVTVSVNATANYFTQPQGMSKGDVPQETKPDGLPTYSVWMSERPTLSPGSAFVDLNNTGNIVRTLVFVLRNSSGARIDTNGWPAVFEVWLDNNMMFSFTKAQLERHMQQWYGLLGSAKDTGNPTGAAGELLTGVYAIPFHALLGSQSGDPANTRAQLLPTLSESQLQVRGQDWGSAVSTLKILTQSITTQSPQTIFAK